ncbi:hypothetical protein BD410DRAFT_711708 [Rickenella mellea]|uniref:Glutamine amidotransferase type-2 domain-containing protein n=1 Tax=Rickenella mellea TaxID=50990 RepID=A0A4Y7QLJ9_9AGAM|nr:hypothetical protein BD410DRAFT_711708 [Rickenella mellea]
MCGILLAVQPLSNVEGSSGTRFETLWEGLKVVNAARGPDAQGEQIFNATNGDGLELQIRFFASELRLRGDQPIEQPHIRDGDVFCWNGEVFEGLDVGDTENDGVKLFELIRNIDNAVKLREILGSIEGPYAFTYFHKKTSRLFYGRDPLGRRSLLIHTPTQENPYFILTSTSVGAHPHSSFEELSTDHIYSLDLEKWPNRRPLAAPPAINRELPPHIPVINSAEGIPDHFLPPVEGLLSQLSHSVLFRVRDIPCHSEKGDARVAVLFSGGIDSTIIAYLADRHLPLDEPIDLLNVAFENPRKMRASPASRRSREAGRERGDVDAYDFLVPDRVTGLEELEELQRLCPRRRWNFVRVWMQMQESLKAKGVVEALMFPARTVMDMSLAIALYFASKGKGKMRQNRTDPAEPYCSTARVLLNGLGSDELLGGYSRHRTTFQSGSWTAVVEELQMEIDRIPTRNLGRDDRIISTHGKEARYPFLSLTVVSYLAGLPVYLKVDPRLDAGIGDKILLRLAAKKVGLMEASERKKRAMQFGTHSARMEAGPSERRGNNNLG